MALQDLYFGSSPPEEKISIEGAVLAELAGMVGRARYDGIPEGWNDALVRALEILAATENIEQRIDLDGRTIDRPALLHLRSLYRQREARRQPLDWNLDPRKRDSDPSRSRRCGRTGGVAITIADEGPGIPPEELHSIFEKFHRVPQRDRGPAGTGLGLAICRSFVEAMGGTIAATNRSEPAGAVFTIIFPASAVVTRQVAPEAAQ